MMQQANTNNTDPKNLKQLIQFIVDNRSKEVTDYIAYVLHRYNDFNTILSEILAYADYINSKIAKQSPKKETSPSYEDMIRQLEKNIPEKISPWKYYPYDRSYDPMKDRIGFGERSGDRPLYVDYDRTSIGEPIYGNGEGCYASCNEKAWNF